MFPVRLGLLPLGLAASGAVAGAGVVLIEAALAARRGFLSADTAPEQDGVVGEGSGLPLRLALLGGSMSAGVGVARTDDTVGRQLARRISRQRGREVRVASLAVAGSCSADLGPQVSRALLGEPDVAVILIGSTDVLRASSLRRARGSLADAVRRLRSARVRTIVGTCPDFGATPAFPQPLRAVIGWRGRALGAVQSAAAVAEGGVVVDLAGCTGAIFRADPGTYSEDGFHPSADGYRLWAEALLPAVAGTPSAPVAI